MGFRIPLNLAHGMSRCLASGPDGLIWDLDSSDVHAHMLVYSDHLNRYRVLRDFLDLSGESGTLYPPSYHI